VSNELVQSVDKKNERRRFTISELSRGFLQMSPTVLYEVVIDRLDCDKFAQDGFRKCSRLCTNAENGSGF
jgi:hypothetical protein